MSDYDAGMAQEPEVEEDAAEPEPDREAKAAPKRDAAPPPLFKRWVVICLLVAVAAGGGALAFQLSVQAKWSRPAPRLDIRYEGAATKLAAPQVVSPSEEYLGPDGEVVFITQDELRAVTQAAALPGDASRKLAAALAERDPTRRAEGLFALVNEVPATPDGDRRAMVFYRFAISALAASPESAARDEAKEKLDRMIGCRFVGPRVPPCPERPSDVPLWALIAVAIVALTAALYGIVAAYVARRRAAREAAPVVNDEAGGDEVEEGV